MSGQRPWFETAFDADYLRRYAHRDEEEARHGVELLARHGDTPPASLILDLCCGAGRHLPPLAEIGAQPLGGDLSMPLLREAARYSFPVVRLDMRQLPFQSDSFGAVVNFFTAFGYFESDEENLAVFQEVSRILKPGGWFFFDFMNATLVSHKLRDCTEGCEEILPDASGRPWRVIRRLTPGGRVEKTQIFLGHGLENPIHESVRLFTRDLLQAGMERAGLEVAQTFGNYDGCPFREEKSPRLILLSRKTP